MVCTSFQLCIHHVVLYICSIIWMKLGAIIIVVGVRLTIKDEPYFLAPLIIAGLIVSGTGVFGFIARREENTRKLAIYLVILLIILLIHIVYGIWVIATVNNDLRTEKIKSFNILMNDYSTTQASQDTVDAQQQSYKCCGSTGPDSWKNYIDVVPNPPKSCCKDKDFCTLYFTEGCVDVEIRNILVSQCFPIYMTTIIELVPAIFVYSLIRLIIKRNRRGSPENADNPLVEFCSLFKI